MPCFPGTETGDDLDFLGSRPGPAVRVFVVEGGDWIELSSGPIPVAEILAWVNQPGCGAIDLFCGTVRDHSEGRPGVERLEYEAYESEVVPRLRAIATEARRRWPDIGRMALWHRTGALEIGEVSVAVAVSTPHRSEAFEATRWCIDTLKQTAPIWKREHWEGGADWAADAHELRPIDQPSEVGR
jgi:molybdopterin synthase catalytic subunit